MNATEREIRTIKGSVYSVLYGVANKAPRFEIDLVCNEMSAADNIYKIIWYGVREIPGIDIGVDLEITGAIAEEIHNPIYRIIR